MLDISLFYLWHILYALLYVLLIFYQRLFHLNLFFVLLHLGDVASVLLLGLASDGVEVVHCVLEVWLFVEKD